MYLRGHKCGGTKEALVAIKSSMSIGAVFLVAICTFSRVACGSNRLSNLYQRRRLRLKVKHLDKDKSLHYKPFQRDKRLDGWGSACPNGPKGAAAGFHRVLLTWGGLCEIKD